MTSLLVLLRTFTRSRETGWTFAVAARSRSGVLVVGHVAS